MLDVIGFGENSIDTVYRLRTLPAGSASKQHVVSRTSRAGGQVATTMAACAALGLRAGYVGAFGDDDGGAVVRRELEQRGVDLRHAMVREAPNRYAAILVDARGERVVLWDRDQRLAVRPEDVRPDWLADTRVVHVDAVDEAASIAMARLGRAAGLLVTSDIDAVTPRTTELVGAVSVPIFGEGVPSALTGESDTERALRRLRRDFHTPLIVTLGVQGSMLLDGEVLYHEPAFEVDVVDTTGAGDVFRAGIIAGRLRGLDGPALLRFANAAAALSCAREGAMQSVPALDEVLALFHG